MKNARLSYLCRSRFADDTIAQALVWPESPLLGVSLYGHGCFLQCIEGDLALIDRLLVRVAALPLGFEARIIAWHPITELSLSHSATHYLLDDVPVHSLLQQHGMSAPDAMLLADAIHIFQNTPRSQPQLSASLNSYAQHVR